MEQKDLVRFVKLWNELKNPQAVSAELGLDPRKVHTLARHLRERGVKLHLCPPGRKGLSPDQIEVLKKAADVDALANPSESPKSSPRGRQKRAWTGAVPPSLGAAFPALWRQWLTFRCEELRKPVTQLSGDQALKELAAMGPERASKAIEHTIARGWQGIREPEPEKKPWVSEKDEALDREWTKAMKDL